MQTFRLTCITSSFPTWFDVISLRKRLGCGAWKDIDNKNLVRISSGALSAAPSTESVHRQREKWTWDHRNTKSRPKTQRVALSRSSMWLVNGWLMAALASFLIVGIIGKVVFWNYGASNPEVQYQAKIRWFDFALAMLKHWRWMNFLTPQKKPEVVELESLMKDSTMREGVQKDLLLIFF